MICLSASTRGLLLMTGLFALWIPVFLGDFDQWASESIAAAGSAALSARPRLRTRLEPISSIDAALRYPCAAAPTGGRLGLIDPQQALARRPDQFAGQVAFQERFGLHGHHVAMRSAQSDDRAPKEVLAAN